MSVEIRIKDAVKKYGSNTVIKLKGSAEKGFTAEVINTYYFISDR